MRPPSFSVAELTDWERQVGRMMPEQVERASVT